MPSFAALYKFSASTGPKPFIALSGGLKPSSSTKNLLWCDLYKSTGKNSIPLSFISKTNSKTGYISLSLFAAIFPAKSISFILFLTVCAP